MSVSTFEWCSTGVGIRCTLLLVYISDLNSYIVKELLKLADENLDELKMRLIGLDYKRILI